MKTVIRDIRLGLMLYKAAISALARQFSLTTIEAIIPGRPRPSEQPMIFPCILTGATFWTAIGRCFTTRCSSTG